MSRPTAGRSGTTAHNPWSELPLLAPMLATPGRLPSPEADAEFGYEVKWDGIRAVAYLDGGRLRLLSRTGRDITPACPELEPPPSALAAHALVLDGEVVAFDQGGKPSFAALQSRMHLRDPTTAAREADSCPVTYIVFDLIHLDGHDLTGLEYRDRRELLRSLGVEAAGAWTCPDYQIGHGADLADATRRHGLEGVIAKRLDSPYLPGRRSSHWIKIKHLRMQEVVIGGWTPGEGRRDTTLGALLLGVPGRGGLEYVGHVGTGFTDRALRDLRSRLDAVGADRSPFTDRMPESAAATARWVRPVIVGEVVYADRTPGGMLRMASWRGLRPDKNPGEVRFDDERTANDDG
ncbi:MAG TPA: non-homologous end-joining DNA ligase [Actinocrinis sp.]|nr:non-homologous end-joining DNA ligase [Actinocrinis sp.]